ncbi:putative membrane protein [Georgenia soli]|uniref:Putative membrane protein n=1 Tax=Georgenia soli TaxID=638953 RepID=A0A2A9EKN3_9MICO|nr:DUF1345 domain-containing protein [Georgenia soli]PFG39353.1 putative membrane protein [Georgenia soli]
MRTTERERLGPSAATRVVVAGGLGAAGGVVAGALAGWRVGPLAGWIVAAAVHTLWMWLTLAPLDGPATAAHAAREDAGRTVAHVVVLTAAVASLGAVALLLARGPGAGSASAQAAFSVLAVALSWAVVHTSYTTRYAHLYWAGGGRPVDFGDTEQPRYTDFAYLAFTVGMTFQVSDTQLRSGRMRAVVLTHALLSYLLGVVVIAATINLVAGLGG